MNALLDRKFLEEIGVTLNGPEYDAISEVYEKVLSERVTSTIVEGLDEPQLEQLHEYRTKPDAELQEWLKSNVPDLKEVIENEVEILLGEIAENNTNL